MGGENESSLKGRSVRDKEKQGRHIQTAQMIQTTPSGWIRASPIENGRLWFGKGVLECRSVAQTFQPSQIDQIGAIDTTEGLKNSPKID